MFNGKLMRMIMTSCLKSIFKFKMKQK